jgi:hypothetical protein
MAIVGDPHQVRLLASGVNAPPYLFLRIQADDIGDCPRCGQVILIGDPVYLVTGVRRRVRRFVCGACAWDRVMKYHPKYKADGWPAAWARTAKPGLAAGGGDAA